MGFYENERALKAGAASPCLTLRRSVVENRTMEGASAQGPLEEMGVSSGVKTQRSFGFGSAQSVCSRSRLTVSAEAKHSSRMALFRTLQTSERTFSSQSQRSLLSWQQSLRDCGEGQVGRMGMSALVFSGERRRETESKKRSLLCVRKQGFFAFFPLALPPPRLCFVKRETAASFRMRASLQSSSPTAEGDTSRAESGGRSDFSPKISTFKWPSCRALKQQLAVRVFFCSEGRALRRRVGCLLCQRNAQRGTAETPHRGRTDGGGF